MPNRKTNEQFQKEFFEHGNKNVQLLGKYITRKTKIPVTCKKCGYVWDAWPDSLLRGAGCRKCAKNAQLTTEDFVERMILVNPDIQVMGSYSTTHKRIEVKCKRCGYKWASMPSNLLRNYGCPNCNGGIKHTKERFLERMHVEHPDIEVLDEYVNSETPIAMKCLRCGKIWKAAPNSMLNGNKTNCPACAHNQSSFLEQLILEICKQGYGVERVLSRDRSIISSELDIVILDENKNPMYAIEPGSWTLHKVKNLSDLKKIDECKEKSIKLLIIYDQDINGEIKETNNIWSYKKSFSIADDKTLLELLKRIMNYFHFSLKIDIETLRRTAYEKSRRMSTDEFIKQLSFINPSIVVLGDYNGSMRKIHVQCRICGYCWDPTPQMLLRQKTGCPKCHNVPRKDTQSFRDEMTRINPNICIMGEYINARTKIRTKCNICGHEWFPTPDKLICGRSCPECAREKAGRSRQKAVRNIDTGEIYPSIASAIKKTGINNISACCRDVTQSAGGYHWEFVK